MPVIHMNDVWLPVELARQFECGTGKECILLSIQGMLDE
jgi:hypothetical protein